VVCDPRKNARLQDGRKSDRIDARKLAELLRTNQGKPVYHGEHGVRTLKELGRSYLTLTQDGTRVMNRIKALYRSWAIPCSGTTVYAPRHRAEWLAKLVEPGVRMRAQRLYQQLDGLPPVRLEARLELLRESHPHPAVKLLRQIPSIGPIRSALLVALLPTPHRFRTKRQWWAYSGFTVETHDRGEYRYVKGKLQRNREPITVRGLSDNYNRDLKNLFQGAALSASTRPGPLPDSYEALMAKGMRPTMARLTLARKMIAITLTLWKKGEFRPATVASASRLSLSGEDDFPSQGFLGWWSLGFWRARFEGEYQSMRLAPCAAAPSPPLHAMPPRRTRNSHRPRASDRTMVALERRSGLPLFRTR
jgi:Transposase/Transposase IS116/IS110/IS902 family